MRNLIILFLMFFSGCEKGKFSGNSLTNWLPDLSTKSEALSKRESALEKSLLKILSDLKEIKAPVGSIVKPLKISIKNIDGLGVANVTLTWKLAKGSFVRQSSALTETNTWTGKSDNAGDQSTPSIKMPQTAGSFPITVSIPNAPFKNGLEITATATAGAPEEIRIVSGNSQAGKLGARLANPFVALVVDAYGNGIADQKVEWSTDAGSLSVASAKTVATPNAGVVTGPVLTLPLVEKTIRVLAKVPSSKAQVTFTATASLTGQGGGNGGGSHHEDLTNLSLNLSGPLSPFVGSCHPYSINIVDNAKKTPASYKSDLIIALDSSSSPDGEFFNNEHCQGSGVSSATLPAETTTITIYFSPVAAGVQNIAATSATLGATLALNVQSLTSLGLEYSGPSTLADGECGLYTVRLMKNGVAQTYAPSVPLILNPGSGQGKFYLTSNCSGSAVTAANLTGSPNTVNLYYKDDTVEVNTTSVTAVDNNKSITAQLAINVQRQLYLSMEYNNGGASPVVTECLKYTVSLKDKVANLATHTSPISLSLMPTAAANAYSNPNVIASSQGGQFYTGSDCAQPATGAYVPTIASGLSTIDVYYMNTYAANISFTLLGQTDTSVALHATQMSSFSLASGAPIRPIITGTSHYDVENNQGTGCQKYTAQLTDAHGNYCADNYTEIFQQEYGGGRYSDVTSVREIIKGIVWSDHYRSEDYLTNNTDLTCTGGDVIIDQGPADGFIRTDVKWGPYTDSPNYRAKADFNYQVGKNTISAITNNYTPGSEGVVTLHLEVSGGNSYYGILDANFAFPITIKAK